MSVWATSSLGISVRRVMCVCVCVCVRVCVCMCVCVFSSWLCCALRFQNSPQTHWWEGFLVFGNFSFMTPSLIWISVPNSFVSLFIFYILSYLLSKRMGCLSGCLLSSTSVQTLLCGTCSAFKWTFDEFVGEIVISPSYSFAILVPHPPHLKNIYKSKITFYKAKRM